MGTGFAVTVDPACMVRHLKGIPDGRHIYIRTHGAKRVLRFTKLTQNMWKHTDSTARRGSYITTKDLAELGEITNPFTEPTGSISISQENHS